MTRDKVRMNTISRGMVRHAALISNQINFTQYHPLLHHTTIDVYNSGHKSNQNLNQSLTWFPCTDMKIVLTGPKGERGEKGDDGEPGISAKSVERVKFERKASFFSVMYYFFDIIKKCYIQYFQNNFRTNFNLIE